MPAFLYLAYVGWSKIGAPCNVTLKMPLKQIIIGDELAERCRILGRNGSITLYSQANFRDQQAAIIYSFRNEVFYGYYEEKFRFFRHRNASLIPSRNFDMVSFCGFGTSCDGQENMEQPEK